MITHLDGDYKNTDVLFFAEAVFSTKHRKNETGTEFLQEIRCLWVMLFLSVHRGGHSPVSMTNAADGDGVGLDVFRQGHSAIAGIA